MLTGGFVYNGYAYRVSAYDYDDNVAMYLTPSTTAAQRYLDKGIRTEEDIVPASWNEFYVSVGIGFVKTDCYIEETANGKAKNAINRSLICKLGEIVRGMKSGSNNQNKENNGELFNNSFNPSSIIKYNFDSGYVRLEMKTIRELEYSGMAYDEELGKEVECSLSLEEDGSYDLKINRQTNVQHKLKLDLSEFVSQVEDDNNWDFGDDTIFSLSDIIEKNPNKSYVWLKSRQYFIVNGPEEVEAICKKIWKHNGIVAFDTETTGLNVNITSRQGIGDRLVGMVFSIEPGIAWYFPVAHKKIKNICTPGNEQFIIEKYFKPILERKELLCHNGSYDWKVMYNYGICSNIVHDTLILFKVTMWNDHNSMSLGLKNLTRLILNRDSFELSDFVVGKFGSNDVKFWDLEEESVKYYACPDTDNLIELFQYCMDNRLLEKYGAKKVYQIEVAFSLVIAYQEYYGHCVDISRIDSLVKDITKTKDQEYAAMTEIVGHDFNPRSSVEVPKVMYKELGYPIFEYTDTGNPSAGKVARKKLMDYKDENGNDKYPLARHLHNYLEAATLESNFTKNISKFATEDGLMFSEVQQFLNTGRVSVSNPNYQSYSDVVKKYIIPRAGYYAMDADYSSVEARIMVSMAGCKNMVDMLKDPDADYHTLKASQMFNIPYELVTHKQRKMSKGVNFGILYGLGDPNLGATLYGTKSPENTRKAKKQKELYFKGMEELRVFIEKSKEQGTTQFFSTTYFGRRRYFDPRRTRKDTIERQSCNARIQGSAADLYKVAMVRLFNQLRKHGWLGLVLISGFIHDECYLEVSRSIDPFIMLKVLRGCMMQNIKGWCPLFIGCGYGHNWYEAKNTEIPIQVQDYLEENYGDTGIDWWKGDIDELCNYVVKTIDEYGRDRVINYLKDENNHGTVLNPAINALAHNVLDALKDGHAIEGADTSTGVSSKEDMIENLEEFCRIFGCEDLLATADVRRPEHKEPVEEEVDEELEDIERAITPDNNEVLSMRLKTFGVYYNNIKSDPRLYIRMDNNVVLMNLVKGMLESSPGSVPVYTVQNGELYKVGYNADPRVYQKLLKTYISAANI